MSRQPNDFLDDVSAEEFYHRFDDVGEEWEDFEDNQNELIDDTPISNRHGFNLTDEDDLNPDPNDDFDDGDWNDEPADIDDDRGMNPYDGTYEDCSYYDTTGEGFEF